MSYFETELQPDEVVTAAARLAGIPEELRNAIESLAAGIRSIDPRVACGDDPAGHELLRAYLGATDSPDGNASEQIVAGSEEICGHIHTLAENTGIAAIETEARDQEAAARIEQLTAE